MAYAGRGAREAAVDQLARATERFDRYGASYDAARVEAQLRRLGVRRGQRGPRQRPALGWESLTPTELDVVRWASEGMTNPEIGAKLFMSRATVKAHLSRIYAKLGISSRAELAAEAARRGAARAVP